MALFTGLKVFELMGRQYAVCRDREDALYWARKEDVHVCDDFASELWISPAVLRCFEELDIIDRGDGIITPGRGLYQVWVDHQRTGEFHPYVNVVHAESPAAALEEIASLSRGQESWSWCPTFKVEMLYPGAHYTSAALHSLLEAIEESREHE